MEQKNLVDDFSTIQAGDILFSGWEKGSARAIDWVIDVDEDSYKAKVLQMWYSKWWQVNPMATQTVHKDDHPDDLLLRHANERDLRETVKIIFKSDTDFVDEQ